MVPGVFGAGVTQINLVVSTAIASLLPTRLGLVSLLRRPAEPAAARRRRHRRRHRDPAAAVAPGAARRRRPAPIATQNRGLELALLLTLPAAVALAVAAQPILAVLFQRGAFSRGRHRAPPRAALAAYAAGLPAFVLVKVLAPGFFARHDTHDAGQDRGRRRWRSIVVLTIGADAVSGPCRDRAGD